MMMMNWIVVDVETTELVEICGMLLSREIWSSGAHLLQPGLGLPSCSDRDRELEATQKKKKSKYLTYAYKAVKSIP